MWAMRGHVSAYGRSEGGRERESRGLQVYRPEDGGDPHACRRDENTHDAMAEQEAPLFLREDECAMQRPDQCLGMRGNDASGQSACVVKNIFNIEPVSPRYLDDHRSKHKFANPIINDGGAGEAVKR